MRQPVLTIIAIERNRPTTTTNTEVRSMETKKKGQRKFVPGPCQAQAEANTFFFSFAISRSFDLNAQKGAAIFLFVICFLFSLVCKKKIRKLM